MGERERGVTEFTGVAILIGMTVIVTASVGLAVLMTPGETNTGPPEANFSFQYFDRSSSILVTFDRGEQIAAGNLSVTSENAQATWAQLAGESTNATQLVGPGASVQASKRNAFGEAIRRDMNLQVVYTGPNGTATVLDQWNGTG